MLDRFHLGGWGMYPTLVLGCFLALSLPRLLSAPSRRSIALTATLAGLVVLSGALGFLMGFMRTLEAAAGAGDAILVYVGTSESLNNVMLSLVILLLCGVYAAIGMWRRREAETAPFGNLGEKPSSP